MNYKIAFCGLGSISKRHIKNVCSFLSRQGDSCEIDLYRSSIKPLSEDIRPLVDNEYLFTEQIMKNYDVVFVTTPTSLHYETLIKFRKHTKSFFIEKPIFDSTIIDETIFELLKEHICYVACPLRYNDVLQYVHKNIPFDKVIAARAISSSYLPDWRPEQDYRKCYSAHKEMGGGVGIDLIHEWDYLTLFFGIPNKCYTIQDKISTLEITSDDIAIYIARTKKTTIELHLDYFGRQSVRKLDLFTADDTIQCDILNGTVSYLKSGQTITFDIQRNKFQMKEIEHFFEIINHRTNNDSTAEHAYAILKLAKGLL